VTVKRLRRLEANAFGPIRLTSRLVITFKLLAHVIVILVAVAVEEV